MRTEESFPQKRGFLSRSIDGLLDVIGVGPNTLAGAERIIVPDASETPTYAGFSRGDQASEQARQWTNQQIEEIRQRYAAEEAERQQ
jgi:hypothetical protein